MTVYVTAETTHTVSVIDTIALKVISTILVGSRPRAAAFTPVSYTHLRAHET